MDTLTVRKRAKEFETIILSNAGTFKLTLSETGLAKALLQAKKEEKRCVVCNWKDCNYTNEEIEECKCPYQTAESILQQFKKEGEKLDKYIRCNEAEITILPSVLKQIEETVYEIEVKEGFGKRLLTFRYIIEELRYSINIEPNLIVSNEQRMIISNWIEKINSILSAEKFVYENEKQIEKVNSNSVTFKTDLNPDQLKELFKQLIDKRFIDPLTYEENFLHVFGEHLPNGKVFEPVKWFKKNSKNWHTLNKHSLIDLLQLLGIKKNAIDFKDKVNKLFFNDEGKSIKMTGSNINGIKHNEHSEYYTDLKNIISNLPTKS